MSDIESDSESHSYDSETYDENANDSCHKKKFQISPRDDDYEDEASYLDDEKVSEHSYGSGKDEESYSQSYSGSYSQESDTSSHIYSAKEESVADDRSEDEAEFSHSSSRGGESDLSNEQRSQNSYESEDGQQSHGSCLSEEDDNDGDPMSDKEQTSVESNEIRDDMSIKDNEMINLQDDGSNLTTEHRMKGSVDSEESANQNLDEGLRKTNQSNDGNLFLVDGAKSNEPEVCVSEHSLNSSKQSIIELNHLGNTLQNGGDEQISLSSKVIHQGTQSARNSDDKVSVSQEKKEFLKGKIESCEKSGNVASLLNNNLHAEAYLDKNSQQFTSVSIVLDENKKPSIPTRSIRDRIAIFDQPKEKATDFWPVKVSIRDRIATFNTPKVALVSPSKLPSTIQKVPLDEESDPEKQESTPCRSLNSPIVAIREQSDSQHSGEAPSLFLAEGFRLSREDLPASQHQDDSESEVSDSSARKKRQLDPNADSSFQYDVPLSDLHSHENPISESDCVLFPPKKCSLLSEGLIDNQVNDDFNPKEISRRDDNCEDSFGGDDSMGNEDSLSVSHSIESFESHCSKRSCSSRDSFHSQLEMEKDTLKNSHVAEKNLDELPKDATFDKNQENFCVDDEFRQSSECNENRINENRISRENSKSQGSEQSCSSRDSAYSHSQVKEYISHSTTEGVDEIHHPFSENESLDENEDSDRDDDDDSFFVDPTVENPEIDDTLFNADGDAGDYSDSQGQQADFSHSHESGSDFSYHEDHDESQLSEFDSCADGSLASSLPHERAPESKDTSMYSRQHKRDHGRHLRLEKHSTTKEIDSAFVDTGSDEEVASVSTFRDYVKDADEPEFSTQQDLDGSFRDNSDHSLNTFSREEQDLSNNASFGDISKGDFFKNNSSAGSGSLRRKKCNSVASRTVQSFKSSGSASAVSHSTRSVNSDISGSYSRQSGCSSVGSRYGIDTKTKSPTSDENQEKEGSCSANEMHVNDANSYNSGERSCISGDDQDDEKSGEGSYILGDEQEEEKSEEGSYISGDEQEDDISGEGSYISGDNQEDDMSSESPNTLGNDQLDEGSLSDEISNASVEKPDDSGSNIPDEESYISGNDHDENGSIGSMEGSYVSCEEAGSFISDEHSYNSGVKSYSSCSGSEADRHHVSDQGSYISGEGSQADMSHNSCDSYVSGDASEGSESLNSGEKSFVSGDASKSSRSCLSGERSYVSGERSYISGEGSCVSGEGSDFSGEGSHSSRSYTSGKGSYVSGEDSRGSRSYASRERSLVSGKQSRGSISHHSGEDSYVLDRGSTGEGMRDSISDEHDGENISISGSENRSQENSFPSKSVVPPRKLPKPKAYGGYSREQMEKFISNAHASEQAASPKKKKKEPLNQYKSDALLDLVEDVHEALLDLKQLKQDAMEEHPLVSDDTNVEIKNELTTEIDEKVEGEELIDEDLNDEQGNEKEENEDKKEDEKLIKDKEKEIESDKLVGESDEGLLEKMLTATRLLYAFEAVVGILLQFSDELELLSTFSKGNDSPAIEALDALLSYTETIGGTFAILRPILLHYQTEEIDEELDDFLYGMNLVVDLLCELSCLVGERQQWNARANCAFATLLELLARDTLEVSCIYEDIDTPDYELSDIIQDAWEETGHVEEIKTLHVTNDLFMFRQICYEVILSTDQWCPDNATLMDICGVDDESESSQVKPDSDNLAPPPEAALQILEKIHGDCLPRTSTLACVLRRLLPAQAITDPAISENFARIRNTIRNPLGIPPSSLISITSFSESLDDPNALGVAGVGKTTLAAMVANHEDVQRFFNDGIAWIYVGEAELNYNRYVQCLQDLLSQLEIKEDEEPLFPELLHSPGDTVAQRRRREEGFMIYLRETMVEFLRFRNVLVILDDVCFESDLDWFDFAPAPLPPDEEEEEEEGSCAVVITSRRRNLLPPADTVEIDMLSQEEAIDLLLQESGELSRVIKRDAPETKSVVLECACHPLTVKSVGRWLNLKHATAGADSVDKLEEDVIKSMSKILKNNLHEDSDMMYDILGMSLSPAINGEPTCIIKFCFAAFVKVFCERKHISDFALADSTPIVPMATSILLFQSLLNLEEESLLKEGSLFYAQKEQAASLIPEALSALGVFKVIITYTEASGDNDDKEEEDEKYLQVMHRIQQEYGEYLFDEDESLTELTKDGERRWNKAFSKAFLARDVIWDTESPDAGQDYALEMLPSHMLRGGMAPEAGKLLSDVAFVRGRLFALGRENGTRRHIKDCEALFDFLKAKHSNTRKKPDPKDIMRSAYETLGALLPMDDDEFIKEEGSPEAVEVGRCHFEIGFSLAEKRIWAGAIAHWENSQEFLVSSLGMVEFVAGILYNIADVYSKMSEYEQALGSLRQCLRIRGAIHGEEHILYAQTIQKIGDVFLSMSDYFEAMESYDWALDVMHIEPSHHRIDIGDILEQMGYIHYVKGEIDEALTSFQDALRSKQVDLGEDHPELATLFHHIGNCLSNQGKTDEAIAHLEEAIRLKQLDPDGGFERDSDVLTIEGMLNNMIGKQQEGLTCYEKALQILVTKVPWKKEKVASLLHLIACVYLMSGEHKKAMKLFEESLIARRKVLGFVHLNVASTLFNMAFLHQTRNRLDKALKCLEEALKIRELRLPNSEKVAVTHEKIGNLARGIGKTKKAENAFTEALRIRKLVHGNSHVAVATVLQELGDLTDDLGEYEEAMKHYVEALEIRENLLGPDDLAVAETYYSMGFTLQNNGALDRALQCLEESLSIRRFQLGDDAKDVGDTLNMMGFLQAMRGEFDDSLSLLWDALRIRKLQSDNIKVSETLNNIGNVHREKQEYDLAIECYEECLRIRRSELGDDNEKVADALIAMGNVQSDMDYTDDAMDSYKEALAIRTMLYGEQDESVATVLQYMGTLEFRANELDRAFQLLDEFIRIRQENGTEPDGDYVNVLFMIGNIHKLLGSEEEAKKCWTEAYGAFKQLGLAETNPQIAEVMSNLVKDEEVDAGPVAPIDYAKKTKSVLSRISAKVKNAARTANEAGKKATGLKGQNRGSQLLG